MDLQLVVKFTSLDWIAWKICKDTCKHDIQIHPKNINKMYKNADIRE